MTTDSTKSSSSSSNNKITAGVSHVGLAVSKLEASVSFFEALGFERIGGVDSYPSIFVSDGSVMVTLWQTDEDATPFDRRKNVGLHHLAIRVPTREALDKAYEVAMGMDGTTSDFAPQPITGAPLHHAMVFEPSGNRIEFTFHE